jgi:hypothetical protein
MRPSIARVKPLSGADPSISGCFNLASKKLFVNCINYGFHGFYSCFFGLARWGFSAAQNGLETSPYGSRIIGANGTNSNETRLDLLQM